MANCGNDGSVNSTLGILLGMAEGEQDSFRWLLTLSTGRSLVTSPPEISTAMVSSIWGRSQLAKRLRWYLA